VISLLWNGYGCFDYLMTNTKGDPYLRQAGMTDAQIAYYHSMPAWMTGVWAIGVWGGALGAILLLARLRWALPVFVISLAAYVASLIYYYLLSSGVGVMGAQMVVMNVVILAACLFFVWYAWRVTKAGLLR
jgi:hypothetical protein